MPQSARDNILTVSLIDDWFMENRFKTYKEYPLLWYIPASIDILFITVCVYYTGLSYSPALLGYVYSTATSSIDLIRARGLYATFGNCLTFLLVLILTKLNVFPYTNIVNQSVTEITLFSILLSTALLFLACVTANRVIFQIYFQFHEKNNELSSSLDKINLLKLQQDADYALTARLMEPFGGNFVKSKAIEIEFLLKQKKAFTFKNQTLEIGGDLLIADELYFQESKFIFFMNADAMVEPGADQGEARVRGRAIHLLYVPTLCCNLGCAYCYLGEQTSQAALKEDAGRAVATLRHALQALDEAGVLAFNVSLHGGEVTTLPPRSPVAPTTRIMGAP